MAKFDPLAHPLCKIYICIHNIGVLIFLFLMSQYSVSLMLGTHRNIGESDIVSNTLYAASVVVMSQGNSQSIL